MFGWLFGKRRNQSREYLEPGRLEDVIALIQVLGLDKHTHRSDSGLRTALRDSPASAPTWSDVGKRHPEFFRVYDGTAGPSVSLIARHLAGSGEDGPVLTPVYIHGLVEAAIRLHQGQLTRKQILRATWAVVAFAVLPSLGTVIAALITRGK